MKASHLRLFAICCISSILVGCAINNSKKAKPSLEINVPLSDRHSDAKGEDIAAAVNGNWEMYVPNPKTWHEMKNDTFWIRLQYHGGWYHSRGFQPKKGNFRLPNYFGVWEHEPEKKQLKFSFKFPYLRQRNYFGYDPIRDCLWDAHENRENDYVLIKYSPYGEQQDQVQLYQCKEHRYSHTDKDGNLRFGRSTAASIIGDQLEYYEVEQPTRYEQAEERRLSQLRHHSELSYLQNDNKFLYEVFPNAGFRFKLLDGGAQWYSYDRDNRIWVHSEELFCLNTPNAPTSFEAFVEQARLVLDTDPEVKTSALRKLAASQQYVAWLNELKSLSDETLKSVANYLLQFGKGKKQLELEGDYLQWKNYREGKVQPAQRLPVPPENLKPALQKEETCPLILGSISANGFAGTELVETAIVIGGESGRFEPHGRLLSNSRPHKGEYFHVFHDPEKRFWVPTQDPLSVGGAHSLRFELKSVPYQIMSFSDIGSENEVLVHIRDKDNKQSIALLNLEDASLDHRGELRVEQTLSRGMQIDVEGRLIAIGRKGEEIRYQEKARGEFLAHDLKKGQYGRSGGIVKYGERLFAYRGYYLKAWDPKLSEVYEYVDGELKVLASGIEGHIYHIVPCSDDVLMLAVRDQPLENRHVLPQRFVFIDINTGQEVDPLFEIKFPVKWDRFISGHIVTKDGSVWIKAHHATRHRDDPGKYTYCAYLYRWDGETLEKKFEWQHPSERSYLSPEIGNIVQTDDGKFWIGQRDRMLIYDPDTGHHRFYRVYDRRGIPLLSKFGNAVMARYGKNTSFFELRGTAE